MHEEVFLVYPVQCNTIQLLLVQCQRVARYKRNRNECRIFPFIKCDYKKETTLNSSIKKFLVRLSSIHSIIQFSQSKKRRVRVLLFLHIYQILKQDICFHIIQFKRKNPEFSLLFSFIYLFSYFLLCKQLFFFQYLVHRENQINDIISCFFLAFLATLNN